VATEGHRRPVALSPGIAGWVGILAVVIVADTRAVTSSRPTMSREFYAHRRLAIPVWIYLTLHLHSALPARWDPLRGTRYGG